MQRKGPEFVNPDFDPVYRIKTEEKVKNGDSELSSMDASRIWGTPSLCGIQKLRLSAVNTDFVYVWRYQRDGARLEKNKECL